MSALSADQVLALRMRGLSFGQIAIRLGATRSQVAGIVFRAGPTYRGERPAGVGYVRTGLARFAKHHGRDAALALLAELHRDLSTEA